MKKEMECPEIEIGNRSAIDKKNCWEIMSCGRGPDSNQEICPAAKANMLDGLHQGINGGRTCWVVAGTLCEGEPSGSFAKKMETCFTCPFYRMVRREEAEIKPHQELLIRLRK